MNEVKKCSKCGSESITKRDVTVMGFWQRGFKAYAYICEKCGYIELYREVKKSSQ